MSLVAVARSKLVAGVDAPGKLTYDWRAAPNSEMNTRGVVDALEVYDLTNALTEVWKRDDAHFVCYVVRQDGRPFLRQPRVKKAGLGWVREQGLEVSADVFACDVDNPGHAPWTPALRSEFEAFVPRCALLARAGIYTTAHGWRIVQPLAHPLPVELFEAALGEWLFALDAAGVRVDHDCRDWTRMFRLPFVRREGRAQAGDLMLERMAPVDPPAAKARLAMERGKNMARRPRALEVARDLPPTWTDRVAPIAAAMAAGGFQTRRHEVAFALAGAMLGRRVPAEYVPAIAAAAIGAAGWDPDHARSAANTVQRWVAGERVMGARWLDENAPGVLEALDGELDAGARRAAAQATPEPTESLAEVTARLEELLNNVPAGLLLVRAQCGLGKTRAAMLTALRRALTPHRSPGDHVRAPLHSKTAISVPTHKLALELAEKFRAEGVEVLRFFGVLAIKDDDGAPVCQFGPAGRALSQGKQSIPWQFCEGRGREKCDLANSCRAYGGREGPKDARVAIGPHAMLGQLDAWAGTTGLLVIDEPPELLVTEVLRPGDVAIARAALIRFEARYAAAMAPALAAIAVWLDRAVPGYVGPVDQAWAVGLGDVDQDLLEDAYEHTGADNVRDAARSAFEPDHKGSFAPPLRWLEVNIARRNVGHAATLGEASRVIGAIWRCLNVDEAVVRVEVRGKDAKPSLVCTWPDEQLRVALRRDGAVAVLDAGAELHRPVMAKVVGYEPPMHVFAAADGAPVDRVLLRTSSATRAAWLPNGRISVDRVARAVRAAVDWALEVDGAVGIITFLPLELALRAALGEDVRGTWGKANQTTESLELVRAALGPDLARLAGRRLELGHYGAMRGLDGWRDLDALATLGDPWRNLGDVQHEVDFLGLEVGWEERVEAQARAELEQAHGRLRTVHRTRPARQLHVGSLVPYGWPAWATRRPADGRPPSVATLTRAELAELVLKLGGPSRAAEAVGVAPRSLHRYLNGARGAPPEVVVALRAACAGPDALIGVTESPTKGSSNRAFGHTNKLRLRAFGHTTDETPDDDPHGGQSRPEPWDPKPAPGDGEGPTTPEPAPPPSSRRRGPVDASTGLWGAAA